jgi:tetraacyldisaccharide 4'-kinase
MRDLDGPPAGWARLLEPAYRLGAGVFHRLYDRGMLPKERLPVPVLSVGNLVVGGTGKTPVVRALAEAALRSGRRPVILTRGYRGSASGVLRAGRWTRGEADAASAGDEPLLLSRALPEVPVVVGKDRAAGACAYLDAGEAVDLFLLDDGFQHRRLHRDRDVVLLDAVRPLGNGRLLPAGPLREPPGALRRADHVILTGGAEDRPIGEAARTLLDLYRPGRPRSRAWTRAGRLALLHGGAAAAAPSLRGLAVHAVAGIARPGRFRKLLEEAGAEVRGWSPYADHHPFTGREVRDEETAARSRGAVPVTTAKDRVRLEGLADPGAGWLVIEASVEVEGGWDGLLRTLLLPRPVR